MATHNWNITEVLETQSQKATTVNEGLHILDAVAGGYVLGISAQPPVSAANGSAWIISSAPTASGLWSARPNQIALRVAGAWRYVDPKPGITFTVNEDSSFRRWTGSQWAPVLLEGMSAVSAEGAFIKPTSVTVGGALTITRSAASIHLSAAGGGGGGGSAVIHDFTVVSAENSALNPISFAIDEGITELEVDVLYTLTSIGFRPFMQINGVATSSYWYTNTYQTSANAYQVYHGKGDARIEFTFSGAYNKGRRTQVTARIVQLETSGEVNIWGQGATTGVAQTITTGSFTNGERIKSIQIGGIDSAASQFYVPLGSRIRIKRIV